MYNALVLFLLLMTFVTTSASAAPNGTPNEKKTSQQCDFMPNTPMPDWVMSPMPDDKAYLYGYGVASAPSDNIAQLRNASINEARRDLSQAFQVKIKSEVKSKTLAKMQDQKPSLSKEVINFIAAESDAVLKSSQVIQLWLQPNSCNLWSKIRIAKSTIDASQETISQSAIASINQQLAQISTKLDSVKKETSTDPRKELANRGIEFSGTAFAESLYRGDKDNIFLFLRAGMQYDDAQDPNGERFEEMFYRVDIERLEASLKVLSDHASKPNDFSYLLLRSIHFGNTAKTKLITQYIADINKPYSHYFMSYVMRRVKLIEASPLCYVNAKIAYFKMAPNEQYPLDDFIATQKFLLSQNAIASGQVNTGYDRFKPMWPTAFDCKTNQQTLIKR